MSLINEFTQFKSQESKERQPVDSGLVGISRKGQFFKGGGFQRPFTFPHRTSVEHPWLGGDSVDLGGK